MIYLTKNDTELSPLISRLKSSWYIQHCQNIYEYFLHNQSTNLFEEVVNDSFLTVGVYIGL